MLNTVIFRDDTNKSCLFFCIPDPAIETLRCSEIKILKSKRLLQ